MLSQGDFMKISDDLDIENMRLFYAVVFIPGLLQVNRCCRLTV